MFPTCAKSWMRFFLATITLSVVSVVASELSISPNEAEFVRNVNQTHHVLCISPHAGSSTTWTGPTGEKVPLMKGRIHTEMRSGKVEGVALVFVSVQKKDEGNYTCSSLVHGKEVKAQFKLIVIKSISFLDTPSVQNATENSQALVRCEVDGEPLPLVVWHVKGKKLSGSSSKYNIVADGLIVKDVTLNDRGKYQCRAFQSSPYISDHADRDIMLNVQHKPTWKTDQRVVEAFGYLSGVVNLTCEASAEPPATYEWTKGNNQSIAQRNNVTIIKEAGRSILQMVVHNKSVFVDYTCKAKNSLGSAKLVFKLREGVKPVMPTHVSVEHVHVESVELNIKSPADKGDIVGYSVQYMKKHRDQENKWEMGTTYELLKGNVYNVTGLQHDTNYLLRVASRNKAGISDYSPAVPFKTLKHSNAATVTANQAALLKPNDLACFTVMLAATRAILSYHL